MPTTPRNQRLFVFAGLHYGIVGHGEGWWRAPQGTVIAAVTNNLRYALKHKIPLCWEIDGLTAEYLRNRDRRFHAFKARLLKAVKLGLFELVDGSYSDPYHQMLDGESNIRQFELGQAEIEKAFGVKVKIYATNEPKTNLQLPQILRPLGYTCVVLAVSQFGMYDKELPPFFAKTAVWVGEDGTRIACIPNLNYYLDHLADFDGFSFTLIDEFNPPPHQVEDWLCEHLPGTRIIHALPSAYMRKFGAGRQQAWSCQRNDSRFAELWAIGHYSGFVQRCRRLETGLVQAESLDALTRSLGFFSSERLLHRGWKYHLAAQHHDEVICETSKITDNKRFHRICDLAAYIQRYGAQITDYVKMLSLNFLADNINLGSRASGAYVAVNVLPVNRRETISFQPPSDIRGNKWALRDLVTGQVYPAQRLKNGWLSAGVDLPAFGYATFALHSTATAFPSPPAFSATPLSLSFDEMFSGQQPELRQTVVVESGPVLTTRCERYFFPRLGAMDVYTTRYAGLPRVDIRAALRIANAAKKRKACFRLNLENLAQGHVESDYPFFSLNPVEGSPFFGMHYANFHFELTGQSLFLCNRDSHVYWKNMDMKSHQPTGRISTPLWVRTSFTSGAELESTRNFSRAEASLFIVPWTGALEGGIGEAYSGYFPPLVARCTGTGNLPARLSAFELEGGFCSSVFARRGALNIRVFNPFPDKRKLKIKPGFPTVTGVQYSLGKGQYRTVTFKTRMAESHFPSAGTVLDSATPFKIKSGKINVDAAVDGLPWKPRLEILRPQGR